MRGDGNGIVHDKTGNYWGLYGAAGLLLRAPSDTGLPLILMQQRASWFYDGTWGFPGGARDSHETAVQAALREASEETGIDTSQVTVVSELITARTESGWTYSTIIGDIAHAVSLRVDAESKNLAWIAESDIENLQLHPGVAESWPLLKTVPVIEEVLTPYTRETPQGYEWVYHG